jgi:hypothetical protein
MIVIFKQNLDHFAGTAKLWEVVGNEGETDHHVVSSAIIVPMSGPECYLFRATAEGTVIAWSELEGSYRGGLCHDTAIKGYEEYLNRSRPTCTLLGPKPEPEVEPEAEDQSLPKELIGRLSHYADTYADIANEYDEEANVWVGMPFQSEDAYDKGYSVGKRDAYRAVAALLRDVIRNFS